MTDLDRVLERLLGVATAYVGIGSVVPLEDAERIMRESWPQPATGERETEAAWLEQFITVAAMSSGARERCRAIAALLRSEPAWVPVDERLPTDSKAYMVRFEDAVFEYAFARYYDGKWRWESGQPRPYDVTHWRPLPAPPKEVTP